MRVALHILAELDDRDLDWTLGAGRPLRAPSGQELLRQGQPVEQLLLVVEGELEVERDGWSVGRLGPGDVVGEMALLRECGSSTRVTVRTGLLALAVPQPDIRRKLMQDKGFSSRMHRGLCLALAERLERADARIGAVAAGAGDALPDEVAELDGPSLEGLARARARFDWLRARVREG